jgi:hypothetical protein
MVIVPIINVSEGQKLWLTLVYLETKTVPGGTQLNIC